MSIEVELLDISSGYNISNINTNFQRVKKALEDGVARSGTYPNYMNADFDLNGKALLNIGDISFSGTDSLRELVEQSQGYRDESEIFSLNAANSAANAEAAASILIGADEGDLDSSPGDTYLDEGDLG